MLNDKRNWNNNRKSNELASFSNRTSRILQRADRAVGKGISPSDCCFATRRVEINEWLTLQKETYAELEQLLSKDKNWILAEKQALNALKEKETVFRQSFQSEDRKGGTSASSLETGYHGEQGVAG